MKKRIIRLLIYEGEDEFVDASIDNRKIKGTEHYANGRIKEYFFARLPDTECVMERIE